VNVAGGHHGHPHNGYFSPWHLDSIEDGPEGEYLTDRLTDEVINLIRTKDHKPFFLNLCYYSVHTPIQAKEDDIAYFEEKALRMGLDKKEALIEGEPYPCDHKKHLRVVRRVIQSDPVYAAMVKAVDDNVGRILQTLEETGELDNTLIVFTSDNGGLSTAEGSPTSNLPLAEGKGWMYEGGTREPLLIRWPGRVAAGSTCDVPVTSTDFYPTFLQAADLDLIPEQHCDGVSLMPLLEGSGSLDREAIFWHYPHYGNQGGTPGCSVRYGDWKLIEFFEDGRLELYNLHEDESEDRDVSGEHPEMTAKLAQLLADWREEVSANMPTPNPDYVPPSLD
ncbi:MAG: sulfatase-like hydrolase/transferase, partial [Phycisphaerae bacterium]